MRFDLEVIASWIQPGSNVLDLGCGNGELLYYLKKNKQVSGTGIDFEESNIAQCIEKGLTVLQGDINEEVNDYADFVMGLIREVREIDTTDENLEKIINLALGSISSYKKKSNETSDVG